MSISLDDCNHSLSEEDQQSCKYFCENNLNNHHLYFVQHSVNSRPWLMMVKYQNMEKCSSAHCIALIVPRWRLAGCSSQLYKSVFGDWINNKSEMRNLSQVWSIYCGSFIEFILVVIPIWDSLDMLRLDNCRLLWAMTRHQLLSLGLVHHLLQLIDPDLHHPHVVQHSHHW